MRVALAFLLAVVILAVGSGYAGWQLGARRTELHWRSEVAKMNMRVLQQQDLKKKTIRGLEQSLVVAAEEAKILREQQRAELEKQRDLIPLSDACNKCRVPRERLLLPEKRGSSNNRVQGVKAAKSRSSIAPKRTSTGLLRPWAGEFYSTRAGSGFTVPRALR